MANSRYFKLLAIGILGISSLSSSSNAAEVTLKGASAFFPGTTYSVNFEALIKRVNETGKGEIQIKYLGGGAKVINPFELGGAVRRGVIDIGNLPGTFYTNIVPEADALKLVFDPVHKMKNKPIYGLLEEIHNKKANAHLLARQKTLVPFHLFVNKPIDAANPNLSVLLEGLKLRSTPIYAPFFKSMGAVVVRMAPGEIFTALERGVVDGYGWPLQGIFDLGWQGATKARVDPGFYNAADEIIVNLDKWKGLSTKQKSILEAAGKWMEEQGDSKDPGINANEGKRMQESGIKIILLKGEKAKAFSDRAVEMAWKQIIKTSPEYGERIKKLAQ